MSTQEREAMEAAFQLKEDISYVRRRDGTTRNPFDIVGFMPITSDDRFVESAKRLADHIEARHARSLQPITVEGLVAMGFEGRPDRLLKRVNGVRLVFEMDGDVVDAFSVGLEGMPYGLWPKCLGDVDYFIERLSR